MPPDLIDEDPTMADTFGAVPLRSLERGTCVGRYLISDVLGQGGMGVVYRAFDPDLGRPIALKMLTVEKSPGQNTDVCAESRSRLLREAQALAKLSHPNVVTVHDVGTFENAVFIAMELIEGKTLGEWLRSDKPTPEEIMTVIMAAGRGLAAAHREGIIHRDFKPANVIVGKDQRVRVLDFGLARATDEQGAEDQSATARQIAEPADTPDWQESSGSVNYLSSSLTQAGTIMGTRNYMAPEQFEHRPLDERVDQFCFCVVLYEALHGFRPFEAKSNRLLVKRMFAGRVKLPEKTVLPDWRMKVILRGLQGEPEERYSSMEQLLAALDHDPFAVVRQARAKRRKKLLLAGAILFFLGSVALGLWYGTTKGSRLCKGAGDKIASVWPDSVRAEIKAAFLATGRPNAQDTFERVAKQFDKYADAWVTMSTEACEAAHVHGSQSFQMMDLRMACLERRLDEFFAVTQLFVTQTDKEVLNKAVKIAFGLSNLSVCADDDALSATIPPPADPKTRAKVKSLRKRLGEIGVLINAGKYEQTMVIAKEVLAAAKQSAYLPLEAEALLRLGKALDNTGKYGQSVQTLKSAALLADSCGHDQVRAKALTTLVFVVGYLQANFEEAKKLAERARGVLVRLNDKGELLTTWNNNIGIVLSKRGEYDQALKHFEKGLELEKERLGAEHTDVASSDNNIGLVYFRTGKLDRALLHLERALKVMVATLGPEHPDVAAAHNNLGLVYFQKGEYQLVGEHYQKALSIWQKTLGPDHPDVAGAHNNLGIVFAREGDLERAQRHYEKALIIWDNALGPNHILLVWALSGLGSIKLQQGHIAEARTLLERAISICADGKCIGAEKEPLAQAIRALTESKAMP